MTRLGQSRAPASAVLDACCLIDLLASRRAEEILRASGHVWHLPIAVRQEIKCERRHDPNQPGAFVKAPVDLSPFVVSGLLTPCQPDDPKERARFVHYATIFRGDGEAMCLAIAESRGWIVATDDRKAVGLAGQAGLKVLSSPQLVKKWADVQQPDPATLREVLSDIQTLACFGPHPSMPQAKWWLQHGP